jgi:hypothetical protein
MKKVLFTLVSVIASYCSFAQTNTFPSSGNVGIGATTPLNGLHIFSTNDFNTGSFRFGFSTTSDAVLSFGYDGISQDAFKISKFPHNSTTGSTNFLTILTNTGNVGIGTTTPSSTLTVDPQGGGGIIIGNPNTSSGGFTSLMLNISAKQNGYSWIQSTQSSGSTYGNLILNSLGGNVGIGTTSVPAKFNVYQAAVLGSAPKNTSLLSTLSGNTNNLYQNNIWIVRMLLAQTGILPVCMMACQSTAHFRLRRLTPEPGGKETPVRTYNHGVPRLILILQLTRVT